MMQLVTRIKTNDATSNVVTRACARVMGERLRHDPAMRWIVGGKAAQGSAASPSQMGRFETQCLAADKNLLALADLSGQWIDRVHARRPPRGIVLDMDSSVSPTHGEQENSLWNGLQLLSSTRRSNGIRVHPSRSTRRATYAPWKAAKNAAEGMTLRSYWTSKCAECPLKTQCTTGKE